MGTPYISFAVSVVLLSISLSFAVADPNVIRATVVSTTRITSTLVDLSRSPNAPDTSSALKDIPVEHRKPFRKKPTKGSVTIPSFLKKSGNVSSTFNVVMVSEQKSQSGSSTSSLSSAGPSLSHSVAATYRGLSVEDVQSVNNGRYYHPPDQALCVGNEFIIEGVNVAWRSRNAVTGAVIQTFSFSTFYGIDADAMGLGWADPICFFDASIGRFITGAMLYSDTDSYIVYSINTNSNSVATWMSWRAQTSPGLCDTSTNCIDDFPQIDYVY